MFEKEDAGKDQNLIPINDPYDIISQLLAGRAITGILDASDSQISCMRMMFLPHHQSMVSQAYHS
jgi:hypothetical protein